MCGEKAVFDMCSCHSLGSPPHVRGKVACKVQAVCYEGITPACAGKRGCPHSGPGTTRDHPRVGCPHSGPGTTRDHPRVCGEKFVRNACSVIVWGSPPRMRGKAGEYGSQTHRPQDHPRVCGEKLIPPLLGFGFTGSPPRMRGKAGIERKSYVCSRITPAYAGKRLKRSRSTVPPVAIVPLFPSVCNKPVVSDGSPAGRDAPLFLPAENAVPASPACNLRSL